MQSKLAELEYSVERMQKLFDAASVTGYYGPLHATRLATARANLRLHIHGYPTIDEETKALVWMLRK